VIEEYCNESSLSNFTWGIYTTLRRHLWPLHHMASEFAALMRQVRVPGGKMLGMSAGRGCSIQQPHYLAVSLLPSCGRCAAGMRAQGCLNNS